MNVNNNYKFVLPFGEKYINLPVEIKWDFNGRQDDIEKYEKTVLDDLLGNATSYEISRYSHKDYGPLNKTEIKYKFHFFDSPNPITASTTTSSDWINSYLFNQPAPINVGNNIIPAGFSVSQLYYFEKPFTKSFFKLDFYDSPETTKQKNYFTVILPTQQGETQNAILSPFKPPVKVKKPLMTLDFVGDKEGFFLYWLRTRDYLDIDTFYMSAKFFDARLGVFVRMMTVPQTSPLLPDKFVFETNDFFYYKVKIDYDTKKYEVFDYQNVRVGNGTEIKWYEYVNP